MAPTPSLKVIKTFTYRGVAGRRWSNRYHLSGGTPADSAHWTTFSDAVVTAEKAIYQTDVTIVETIGYAAGSEVPVFSKTYSTVGTGSFASALAATSDSAGLVRYATAVRSAKNHPVYLFNYYHGVNSLTGSKDTLNTAQGTAMSTYATAWTGAGFSDGTTSYNRAGPNGATATGFIVETFLTHRDLPR